MQSRLSSPGFEFSCCPLLLTPAGADLNTHSSLIVVRVPDGVFKMSDTGRHVVGMQQMIFIVINRICKIKA